MYTKHNLFWGIYKNKKGTVNLPENCKWKIMKLIGSIESGGVYTENLEKDGQLVLVLEDETNHFWSVISFLTVTEAVNLSKQLLEATKKPLLEVVKKIAPKSIQKIQKIPNHR